MAAPAPSQHSTLPPPAPSVANQGQGVTPNPLPAAPPVAQPPQPMQQPPTMQQPPQQMPLVAPAGAPGHPMPTHYQHQSQPIHPANPLPQQHLQPPAPHRVKLLSQCSSLPLYSILLLRGRRPVQLRLWLEAGKVIKILQIVEK